MKKKNTSWMKVTAIFTAAVLFLSGCGMEDMAEAVAVRVKEKIDAMFALEKWTPIQKKELEYFVQEEPEEETPAFVSEGEVQWHDEALSKAIAYLLDTEVSEITYAQLGSVKSLDLSETENNYGSVKSFEDLTYFTGLETLDIHNRYLDIETTDYSPIGKLTSLKCLWLDGITAEDFSFIANLTELTELYVMDSGVQDISFVENLEQLWNVSFYGNYLMDVSPLAGHDRLEVLSLAQNSFLQDISPLAQLPVLNEVGLHYCNISDIAPLTELENLELLNLSGNPISNLEELKKMPQLKVLALDECGLKDISPLAELTGLKQLYLENNELTDISSLAGLTELSDLRLSQNEISDFRPLQNINNLFRLNIYKNPIEHLPENALSIPYLDAGMIYSWIQDKPAETVQEETALAEKLMEEYCSGETGRPMDMISGYLNDDAYEDIVIMVEQEDSYKRTFYVFLGEKNGNFQAAGAVSTPDDYLEITEKDSYYGMLIANHNLIISYHIQDVFGWLDTSYYQYKDKEMVLSRLNSVNYCVYSSGADFCEYDFLHDTSCYGVYVEQEHGMNRMLLQTGDSSKLYKGKETLYPELDAYYDFYCFQNILDDVDEAFEAILQEKFTEYEKKELSYTPETLENYTRLTGTHVPDYYYETDGGNLYFATAFANSQYEVFQVFAYQKDGIKDYYLYNIVTKEVVSEEGTLYN